MSSAVECIQARQPELNQHRRSRVDEAVGDKPQTKRSRRDSDDVSDKRISGRKRARATRACDQCRRRKERCDSREPRCGSCLSMDLCCIYSPTKKRGLRAGQFRSLEIILGLVFQFIEGSETWISTLLEGAPSSRPVFRFRVPPAVEEGDAVASLLGTCRKSTVLRVAEQLLFMSESADDEDDNNSTDTLEQKLSTALQTVVGLSDSATDSNDDNMPDINIVAQAPMSPMDTDTDHPLTCHAPMALSETKTSPKTHQWSSSPSTGALPAACAPSGSLERENAAPPLGDMNLESTGHGKLPSRWPQLLELYFSQAHCWFPICEKHELLRAAYLMDTTANSHFLSTSPGLPSKGDRALLWAVLAYSSHILDSRQYPLPDRSKDMCHQEISAVAHKLVSRESNEYNGELVQAWLVLALLRVECGQWDVAWTAMGRAISIASCHGVLSLAPKSMLHNIKDGERRIFLGCFVLETLIAARLQRRPYLQCSDVRAIGLLSQDGIEEWEPWTPSACANVNIPHMSPRISYNQSPGRIPSVFNQFVELMGLSNEILRRFDDEAHRIAQLQAIDSALQAWNERLHVSFQDPSDLGMPPHLLNLHLASAVILENARANQDANLHKAGRTDVKTWAYVHDMCKFLKRRICSLGTDSLPSTASTFLQFLDQSFTRQEQLRQEPIFKEQMKSVRGALHEIQSLWQGLEASASGLSVGASHEMTGATPDADVAKDSREPMEQQLGVIDAVMGPPRQSQPVDPALFQQLGILEFIGDPPSVDPGRANDQQTSEAISLTRNLSPGIDFTPLAGDMFGSGLDDEALFDSLTMLDSTDWYENINSHFLSIYTNFMCSRLASTPQFMRHLGVCCPSSSPQ